jgi:5,6-dimethylbenzimidazole synthase
MTEVFPETWKRGLYEAIVRRRDMREFRPDPVPRDVLARILNAAHHAGSVGYSQPWNFLVVEDLELRRRIHAHVTAQRLRAADAFEGERREKYLSLKLEGILEAPLNLCVTCNTSVDGEAVLGRYTIRETDIYSTCCAVQNLWLAARCEGVGVGWVSIMEPATLSEMLEIPAGIMPVAYLCVGYVDRFPERPTLEKVGWGKRRPLQEMVFMERWGQAPDDAFSQDLEMGSTLEHV